MKVSLLAHTLATPADRMYYIDTVDKAGRWDIPIYPVKHFAPHTDRDYLHGCYNKKPSWTAICSPQNMLRADKSMHDFSNPVHRSNQVVNIGINELIGPSGCSFPSFATAAISPMGVLR